MYLSGDFTSFFQARAFSFLYEAGSTTDGASAGALVGVAAGSGSEVGTVSVVGAAPDAVHADSTRTDTARAAVRNFTGIPSDVSRDLGAPVMPAAAQGNEMCGPRGDAMWTVRRRASSQRAHFFRGEAGAPRAEIAKFARTVPAAPGRVG